MRRVFPWYDSNWLNQYVAAKTCLREHCPHRLADFVEALAPLMTRHDFQVQRLDRGLPEQLVSEIKSVIRSLKIDRLEMHEAGEFGRLVVHDDPTLSRLQESQLSLVGDLVGEPVECSYNFLSLYTTLGRCPVHMDAPDAKWTLDICIDQSEPWPLHVSQTVPWPEEFAYQDEDWREHIKTAPEYAFASHDLKPGEALVFSGSSQWHYRDALPRDGREAYCHLLFFHFIPKGMREIVKPCNWPRIFDVQALAKVVGQSDE